MFSITHARTHVNSIVYNVYSYTRMYTYAHTHVLTHTHNSAAQTHHQLRNDHIGVSFDLQADTVG